MSTEPDQPEPTIMELSIVMPCLNEAETLETCIRKARGALASLGVLGEVIVADNGSTDGSQELARQCGARVVDIPQRGYGAALQGGIAAARGRYIIMGDADDSYDFSNLEPFLEKLRAGFDLVMGNRFQGGVAPGAMPALHRYLGNPVLSFIGRLFFRNGIGDFHCGLRGFSKAAVVQMDLQTTGMEFASEMVVKATLLGMRIAEVPTTLSPDGRSRPPHLRSWRDGWRHLRFLLMYSPRWLFLYPGLTLMMIGILLVVSLALGPVRLGKLELDIHTMLYASAMVIVGFQAVLFAVFTKRFAIQEGLLPRDPRMERAFRWINLENGLLAAGALLLGGFGAGLCALLDWWRAGFGPLDPQRVMRWAIASVLLLSLGIQIGLASFFVSILSLRRKR